MIKFVSFVLGCLCLSSICGSQMFLQVDDFNFSSNLNKLGGAAGCWNYNPSDADQYCRAAFDKKTFNGDDGASLKLEYDIDTPKTYFKEFPNTSFNGYFTKLNSIDLSKFKYLVMYIKGDSAAGFTRNITVELKNARQSEKYVVEGITDSWKKFIIPLWQFKNISDWSAMNEMVITFDDKATKKTGAIYIDDIYFTFEANPPKLYAEKLQGGKKITIDGRLDDWGSSKGIMRFGSPNIETGVIKDTNDFAGTAFFKWDDEYLYFAVDANDDQLACREKWSNIWKEDCVELYIDPMNDGFIWNNKKDFQLGFTPPSADGKMNAWAWFQNRAFSGIGVSSSSVTAMSSTNSYQIEAAIPWKFLGVTPQKGLTIGISTAFHDFDDKDNTSAKLNWFYIPEGKNIILGKLILR